MSTMRIRRMQTIDSRTVRRPMRMSIGRKGAGSMARGGGLANDLCGGRPLGMLCQVPLFTIATCQTESTIANRRPKRHLLPSLLGAVGTAPHSARSRQACRTLRRWRVYKPLERSTGTAPGRRGWTRSKPPRTTCAMALGSWEWCGDWMRFRSEASHQLNRCRTASNKHTPVATLTFKHSTMPLMGIRARWSHFSPVSRRMPSPSAPMTMPIGPFRSTS
jgi:hypothetical protein